MSKGQSKNQVKYEELKRRGRIIEAQPIICGTIGQSRKDYLMFRQANGDCFCVIVEGGTLREFAEHLAFQLPK